MVLLGRGEGDVGAHLGTVADENVQSSGGRAARWTCVVAARHLQ